MQAFTLALALCTIVAPLAAVQAPETDQHLRLIYRHPDLYVSQQQLSGDRLGEAVDAMRFAVLGVDAASTQIDLRTGRFATLLPVEPLLPGTGVGNQLRWADLGLGAPQTRIGLEQAAWEAVRGYLERNAEALAIDPAELANPGKVTVLSDDHIIVYVPRVVAGWPVIDSHLTLVLRFGNLVSLGTVNWAEADATVAPAVSREQALASVRHHLGAFAFGSQWKGSQLAWVPVSTRELLAAGDVGQGLELRLVWVVRPDLGDPSNRFEAYVDARTAELLSFHDTTQWAATQRKVAGGVYPVANDGLSQGGFPDGIEQAGWPMSFSSVTTPTGVVTTDIGGNLPLCVDGTISSALSGPSMRMADVCGAASLSGAGDLDFGASAGTDCTTPGFGGAGNTHASRSGFHEMNMMKEMARRQLPSNAWLQQQLTANMNVVATCNANWNGSQVNFFRSGGGCRNTGEIAGIFDHEWGHGMDNNDATPTIANPGEGIADIYASLRLHDSCVGRGFRANNAGCGGYGNPCVDPDGGGPLLICSGVRDIDWDNRQNGVPTTIAWIDANCGSGPAPCGGGVHCEGAVYAEAVWDLWNRELTSAPYSFSRDLAREVATQLTFRAAGGVSSWYSCTNGAGCTTPNGCGCAATNGYMQYIAADDDNGNLNDGTPHMQEIFDAFNAHNIACTVPTVVAAGCAGRPALAPTVTPTARDKSADLSWTSVAGASSYRVYRTDGVFSCDFGKILVGETAGTTFTDRGLQNGRTYYYRIEPMGANDECFGTAMSACTPVTPSAAGGGAVFTAVTDQFDLSILSGDHDLFLDNCEQGRVRLPLANAGSTTLTNVRILAASSPSHPSTTFVTTFPKIVDASLVSCESAVATLEFIPQGVTQGSTFTIDMDVTADQLTSPAAVSFTFALTEGDFQNQASSTFSFEASTQGWQTTAGTFNRTNVAPGGAGGAGTFYYQSSAFLDQQCDVVQSPVIRLTGTSTMTLSTHFRTETNDGQWWDRANIGVLDLGTGVRTRVDPSGGRLYNASGVNGTCGTEGQPGWAGVAASWASSTWSSAALQTGTLAGKAARLEVRYGTDPLVNDDGFRFDDVTLTNFDLEVADAQSNTCGASNYIFADDFETGNTQEWSQTSP